MITAPISVWQLRWRRFRRHRAAIASVALLALLILFSVLAAPVERGLGIDANVTDLMSRFGPPSAEHWLGQPVQPPLRASEPAAGTALAELVTRYLGAFGPATVRDVQAWSGLTGLKAVLERLRPSLVTFRDEQRAELFDLPGAPRPGPDVPAPVRLVAEFDNLVLSHADRSRVISPENFKRLSTINGIFPGSVLIDGFVAGMWRLASRRSAATLTIELFGPIRKRDDLEGEAARMLAFCAPDAAHDIRFAPVAG